MDELTKWSCSRRCKVAPKTIYSKWHMGLHVASDSYSTSGHARPSSNAQYAMKTTSRNTPYNKHLSWLLITQSRFLSSLRTAQHGSQRTQYLPYCYNVHLTSKIAQLATCHLQCACVQYQAILHTRSSTITLTCLLRGARPPSPQSPAHSCRGRGRRLPGGQTWTLCRARSPGPGELSGAQWIARLYAASHKVTPTAFANQQHHGGGSGSEGSAECSKGLRWQQLQRLCEVQQRPSGVMGEKCEGSAHQCRSVCRGRRAAGAAPSPSCQGWAAA